MTAATPVRLLRMAETLARTSLKSRSTVYELEAAGLFPRRVKLTGKAIAFVESEIEDWIKSRIEARPAPETIPPVLPARLRLRPTAARPPTTACVAPPAPRRRGPARPRAQRQPVPK